ncbi:MAG: YitT family protein, partial [Chitinophagales bacterium]
MKMSHSIDWSQIYSLKNMMFILVGTTCGVFAMKGFMIPNHLMDGGVTGVYILIHDIYHINISL